jgi:putative ABC transport system permease protein
VIALDPHPDAALAAITLTPDAPPGAARAIAKGLGQAVGQESTPGVIVNVARVRNIPAVLAVLLAVLALLTIVHALIVSIQGRRHDVAVLRALGADRRWVARTVHWQATVLTVLPLVFGIPVGIVVGSFVFRAFVARIGAVPDPAIPIVLLLGLALALVAVANIAAVVPARRARRLSTAALLQAE